MTVENNQDDWINGGLFLPFALRSKDSGNLSQSGLAHPALATLHIMKPFHSIRFIKVSLCSNDFVFQKYACVPIARFKAGCGSDFLAINMILPSRHLDEFSPMPISGASMLAARVEEGAWVGPGDLGSTGHGLQSRS